MRVIGIIAEYNPFHKGHDYQIRQARSIWGNDVPIVVVMSGNFVQRGEPALASKWVRTRSALLGGADLVIEIPFTFACASAERFAQGAVQLLNSTGIVTDLFFGSEYGDLSVLNEIAQVIHQEPAEYLSQLKAFLQDGNSFAKAREKALSAYFESQGNLGLSLHCQSLLKLPNTILALEYLVSLQTTGSSITPNLLQRQGAGYHDLTPGAEYTSATAIRKIIENICLLQPAAIVNDTAQIASSVQFLMPATSLAVLLEEWGQPYRPVFPADLASDVVMALSRATHQDLEKIAYMGDGVVGRMKNALGNLREDATIHLWDNFMNQAHTKRYSNTRLNRALISLLCGQSSVDLETLATPEYLRVLGFSKKGRYLLRLMRKASTLPIVDKASDFLEHSQNTKLCQMAGLDLLSTDLWNMKAGYSYGREYEERVIQTP